MKSRDNRATLKLFDNHTELITFWGTICECLIEYERLITNDSLFPIRPKP